MRPGSEFGVLQDYSEPFLIGERLEMWDDRDTATVS
jgi:hypothetical protein